MPGPRAAQNLQMPHHLWDWKGGGGGEGAGRGISFKKKLGKNYNEGKDMK